MRCCLSFLFSSLLVDLAPLKHVVSDGDVSWQYVPPYRAPEDTPNGNDGRPGCTTARTLTNNKEFYRPAF